MWKKITHALLEINDVSFRYYAGLYIILLFLDRIWEGGFVLRFFYFPLSHLFWFLVISAGAKAYSNSKAIVRWLNENSPRRVRARLDFNILAKKIKSNLHALLNHLFCGALLLYLVSLLAESEGGRLNLSNKFLALALISGVLAVFSDKRKKQALRKERQTSGISMETYFLFIGFSVVTGFIIFKKTQELGWASKAISFLSGLLIILLSVIIAKGEEYLGKNKP